MSMGSPFLYKMHTQQQSEMQLFIFPIMVESPISCFAREVGDPVLLFPLVLTSSELKVRLSEWIMSCILSEITIPQLLQITSPDSTSVTMLSLVLHIEQTIVMI